MNALEGEFENGDLIPGEYVLHVGVIGSYKSENVFKHFELNAVFEIAIE